MILTNKDIRGRERGPAGNPRKGVFKLWTLIKALTLLLLLVSGSVLICQWWTRRQQLESLKSQLEQKERENQQQYELQKGHLISTASLAKSSNIQTFFTDLLNIYAEKFAKSKEIDISPRPLNFEGLYLDQNIGKGLREMGRCSSYFHPRPEVGISLNRVYLLNKFGHDCYFTTYPQGDYYYIDISFAKMIKTCSHEIAHYIQQVKHGKSSCESDLKLGGKEYNPELAKEHEKFTREINQLIKNSGEYLEWEKRWKEID